MSTIRHYVRTLGPDGGVEVCDGPAIGLDLASMLEPGLPPWNVALQIFAGLCEILDIADQDRQFHGDLALRDVFVDDTGAVSVEGLGVPRTQTSAPEGTPRGHATDLYGLGRILFALLCDRPLPALPTHDPAAHDDAVIDAVLLVDLDGLPDEMQGDVQWFLAKLLSHDPAERPSALEAWRTFVAFADALEGPDFVAWCSDAVDGGGTRRPASKARTAPAAAPEEEQLGGPIKRAGPLSGGMSFGPTGGSARGGATAFWTRDQMKAALEQGDDEDEDDRPFRPAVGGGAATAFWSAEELAAMQRGSAEAPRPKRSSKRSQTLMMALPRPGGADAEPESEPPAPAPAGPVASGPVASGPVASGPVAAPPPAPAPGTPPVASGSTAPAPRRRLLIVAAAALAGLFLLTCLGIGGIGAWFVLRSDAPAGREAALPEPAPTVLPSGATDATRAAEATGGADAAGEGDAEPAEAEPPPAPAAPKPEPARAPAPASPAPARTTPSKPAAPAPPPPAPTTGPAKVRLSSSGRGSVSCAGNQQAFDGAPITLVVEGYQLPATCLVELDGQRGVFQVYGSGSVRCEASGGGVNCDPAAVK